ncbi:hypothetical protein A2Z33_00550 [Candidatus Gottesmanbacteria bacterium RBG_16_52_11]|uniref:Uncharacterized protein n=1 Tax=Candidatus Gottesmanbacteria bacterium RBG_16_52_11 TaxID=1798374 RepID=A0A1F5YMV0_9BACT|nr:MAG: hypothetical protein A2Z33_00550 [Candidatus Gottesmanbacteria bacterium RBG_16_52_11]
MLVVLIQNGLTTLLLTYPAQHIVIILVDVASITNYKTFTQHTMFFMGCCDNIETNFMFHEFPAVNDRLVFHPDAYKVIGILKVPASTWVNGEKLELQDAGLALVMPKEPGGGDFTTGFDMMLVRIKDGKLSSMAADVMRLHNQGSLGFIASGTGFTQIYLEDPQKWRDYKNMGWGNPIQGLIDAVSRNEGIIKNDYPTQEDYEQAAFDIAPSLARFFNLSPEE